MKKKLVVVLTMLAMIGGVVACGAKETEVEETAEIVEETIATPMSEETAIPQTEVSGEKETEMEQAEEVQEIAAPVWYMDEEGIKSEELGFVISRNSAEWDEFGFNGSCMVHTAAGTSNFNFECYYYEGDIDSYIAEHESKEMEKVTLDNIVFAVKEPNEHDTTREAVIAGDGIVFSVTLWDHKLEDIWKTGQGGLDIYEEEKHTDYLAYIEDYVLYIPVLGIKFSGEEEENAWGRLVGNYVDVYCSDAKYDENHNFAGGYIKILNNEYERNEKNAEECIDDYINTYVERGEWSAFEEVLEYKLGKNTYIGKGADDHYGRTDWRFATDETPWEIEIWCTEEYEVNKYLPLIEELK